MHTFKDRIYTHGKLTSHLFKKKNKKTPQHCCVLRCDRKISQYDIQREPASEQVALKSEWNGDKWSNVRSGGGRGTDSAGIMLRDGRLTWEVAFKKKKRKKKEMTANTCIRGILSVYTKPRLSSNVQTTLNHFESERFANISVWSVS